jgi:TolB-like protein
VLDAWRQSRRQLLENESDGAPAASASESSPPISEAGPIYKESISLWIRRALLVAALTALALAAGVYVLHWDRGSAVGSRIGSLAVLPLRNLSGDPAQEYLAEGMTEELIGRLAQIRGLRVISHTSVMRFKDPRLSVPEIARMLHVDAIVEGSVMRSGERIRVAAQLIRGTTDEHFWSETYEPSPRKSKSP